MFIKPMLAAPMSDRFSLKHDDWYGEEKFDGIRLIVDVDRERPEDLLTDCTVHTWSRLGISHAVPQHLREALRKLPTGTYDTELFVPGKRSYGATRLIEASRLEITIFDMLRLCGEDVTDCPYVDRRQLLTQMFAHSHVRNLPNLHLAESRRVTSMDEIVRFRDEVWSRDGEGLILKRAHSLYLPNKRRISEWVKVKDKRHAVLTVIGFQAGVGEIIDNGPYATIVLRDDDGNVTTVKTRNGKEIRSLELESRLGSGPHPAIGRKLRIEYQERTPDGNYRHPVFDHWITEKVVV